jgi:hypothetical protein
MSKKKVFDQIAVGLVYDMQEAVYYSDPCPTMALSQSLVKVLLETSPRHAALAHPWQATAEEEPPPYDKAMAIGSATHKLLLGRGKNVTVIYHDSFRKKDAQELRTEAIKQGNIAILEKHMMIAEEIHTKIGSELVCSGFVPWLGKTEVALFWREGDIWLRSLIDLIENGKPHYWDIKTTAGAAAPQGLSRKMADGGWHIQAAFQERGLDVVDPQNAGRRKFFFVLIEQSPPFAHSVCRIPESAMVIGRKQVDQAVRIWAYCLKTGVWPSYPPQVHEPELPPWYESQWLAREINEAASERRPSNNMLTDLSGG